MFRLVVLVVLVAIQSSSAASDEAYAMGPGANSCAKFAKDLAIDPMVIEATYFSWAQGYMSGMNSISDVIAARTRDLQAKSTVDERGAIRAFCDAHPLKLYMEAVLTLYRSLPVRDVNPAVK